MASYFEAAADAGASPGALLADCVERGASAVLLDEAALSPAFFDLSSGVAGELLHKLSSYRIRLAGVVSEPEAHSEPFQQFMREANTGSAYRFFRTRQEAVDWLDSV